MLDNVENQIGLYRNESVNRIIEDLLFVQVRLILLSEVKGYYSFNLIFLIALLRKGLSREPIKSGENTQEVVLPNILRL